MLKNCEGVIYSRGPRLETLIWMTAVHMFSTLHVISFKDNCVLSVVHKHPFIFLVGY